MLHLERFLRYLTWDKILGDVFFKKKHNNSLSPPATTYLTWCSSFLSKIVTNIKFPSDYEKLHSSGGWSWGTLCRSWVAGQALSPPWSRSRAACWPGGALSMRALKAPVSMIMQKILHRSTTIFSKNIAQEHNHIQKYILDQIVLGPW